MNKERIRQHLKSICKNQSRQHEHEAYLIAEIVEDYNADVNYYNEPKKDEIEMTGLLKEKGVI